MHSLLELSDRTVYLVLAASDAMPAVFYIADRDAGGILVNAPPWSSELAQTLHQIAPLHYLFLPSHYGASHALQWQLNQATLNTIASPEERDKLNSLKIDSLPDRKTRFTRTIGFLSMSGRTAGCIALHLRNLPGVVFFGPALDHEGSDGWPALVPHDDDYSWENRVIGSLGLQSITFDYAFCDNYRPGMAFGPGASREIVRKLDALHD